MRSVPAPGGLPGRPRRRASSRGPAPSTATTCSRAARCTGERDVRSEDRQLLLDALLAAGETLVVTYTGANEHSGASRPPAVPLGRDPRRRRPHHARRRCATRVLVRHPLQPYDARNLGRGALVGDRPFSFDRAALAGAPRPPAGERPSAAVPARAAARAGRDDVSLADLKSFLAHPVRDLPAPPPRRLDAARGRGGQRRDPGRPRRARAVGASATGCCARCWPGQDPTAVMTAEQLRGTLPPGGLGTRALHRGRRGVARGSSPAPPTCAPARRAASTSTSTSVTAAG